MPTSKKLRQNYKNNAFTLNLFSNSLKAWMDKKQFTAKNHGYQGNDVVSKTDKISEFFRFLTFMTFVFKFFYHLKIIYYDENNV